MLGKTAGALYWMARYLERSENNARLIDAGFRIALTRSSTAAAEWKSVLVTAGVNQAFQAAHGDYSSARVIDFLRKIRQPFDERVPGAELVELPGLGHLAHEERPATVAKLLRQFARRTGVPVTLLTDDTGAAMAGAGAMPAEPVTEFDEPESSKRAREPVSRRPQRARAASVAARNWSLIGPRMADSSGSLVCCKPWMCGCLKRLQTGLAMPSSWN